MIADPRHAGAAVAACVRGGLPRDAPAERVGAALLAASEGLLVVDEALVDALLGRRNVTDPLVETPTPRALEVLGLLAEGLANKAIAARLAIVRLRAQRSARGPRDRPPASLDSPGERRGGAPQHLDSN